MAAKVVQISETTKFQMSYNVKKPRKPLRPPWKKSSIATASNSSTLSVGTVPKQKFLGKTPRNSMFI